MRHKKNKNIITILILAFVLLTTGGNGFTVLPAYAAAPSGTYSITSINIFNSSFNITLQGIDAAHYYNVYKKSNNTLVSEAPVIIGTAIHSVPAVFGDIADLEIWAYKDNSEASKVAVFTLNDQKNLVLNAFSVSVNSVTLDYSTANLKVGQDVQLNAAVNPSYVQDASVIWTIQNQSTANVISLTSQGRVSAIKPGTAVVRAISRADNSKYAECTVSVTEAVVPPTPTPILTPTPTPTPTPSPALPSPTPTPTPTPGASIPPQPPAPPPPSNPGGGAGPAPMPIPPTGAGKTPVPVPSDVTVSSDGSISAKPKLNENGSSETKLKTEDLDKAFVQTASNGRGEKIVVVVVNEVKGTKDYLQQLPAKSFSTGEDKKRVEINTPSGTVNVPCNMFASREISNADNVGISIGYADASKLGKEVKDKIGSRPIVELRAMIDGKTIEWKNDAAPVEVSINYTPTAEELNDSERIVVWYIDGSGNAVSVPNGRYDKKTGKVVFTVTHFSKYAVAYNKKTFTDIKNSKVKKEIEVMAAKGIISGISDSLYGPERDVSRADFIALLVKAMDLRVKADTNFADVRQNAYYYNSVGMAKKLGIISGSGNNLFKPGDSISRQDMMVITAKALSIAGKIPKLSSAADLSKISDYKDIAAYAKPSIDALQKAGIIQNNGKALYPRKNATREQIAEMIYRIYNLNSMNK